MAQQIEETLDEWVRQNPTKCQADPDSHKQKRRDGNEAEEPSRTKVADIVFSFDNRKLILGLRARGKAIANNDFNTMRQEDWEIQQLLVEFEKLTVPTDALITFESDDSKIFAMKNDSQKQLLGQEFRFKDASEPTDIIWENRHFTRKDYIIRELFAFGIIVLLLFVSLLIIMYISLYSARMAATFPPQNCAEVQSAYGAQLGNYAINDYQYLKAHTD